MTYTFRKWNREVTTILNMSIESPLKMLFEKYPYYAKLLLVVRFGIVSGRPQINRGFYPCIRFFGNREFE